MTTNPTTRNQTRVETDSQQTGRGSLVDRAALRLSASLLLGGQLLYILITQIPRRR